MEENNNISADYLIFGNKGGFECDTVLELLRQMDTNERDSAIRILTEFSVSLARAKWIAMEENKKWIIGVAAAILFIICMALVIAGQRKIEASGLMKNML